MGDKGFRRPSGSVGQCVSVNGSLRIDKNVVIGFLRSRGDQDKAAFADSRLPQEVDTRRDYRLPGRLGVKPSELLGSPPGDLSRSKD